MSPELFLRLTAAAKLCLHANQPLSVIACKLIAVTLLAGLTCFFPMVSLGQADLTSVSANAQVDSPSSAGKALGYADAGALSELVAYTAAIGGAEWKGMTATGHITFDGDQTTAYTANFLALPGNRTKLEIDAPKGRETIVFNGAHGSIASAGEKKAFFAPSGAMAGFAPFDLPLRAARGGARYSIIDRGAATLPEGSFHRISIETAIAKQDLYPYQKDDRSIVDLYFDPSSHLLVESVSVIPLPGSSRPAVLKMTTYSGYSRTKTCLLPTKIRETVNGQRIWDLTIDSVDLDKKPSSSTDFIF